ncbi:sodium-dependent transporter [Desulfuromonas acetoxidans]|uniref:sodium-dependent transporter n=1 Tax=Desulfuromonas acetoxidans TaxID=891 RepID=UPI002930730F|nr:sodium-dependent transporter [Desulfuromonas acetoxidans]
MTQRSQWASRLGFILAASGSSIGLGNIWKFPYVAGQNGGGAFVLVYLVSILLVGIPIMMAEFLLGREGGKDAIGSFARLAGKNSPWRLVGWTSVIAAFILLSFYAVVAGWCFDYVVKSAAGTLQHASPEQISALFSDLLSSPGQMIFWQACFLMATAAIVSCGIQHGIERWSKILMPLLFLLLLYLFVHGLFSGGAGRAAQFLFSADFSLLTPQSLLAAVGHSFFTLSLGAGVMITYGSYLDRQADLFSMAIKVSALDTMVALLAGMAIFPVVFSAGLDPGAGPGLVFQTIPIVFSSAPMGWLLAVVFFLLLAFAALSSSISMLEVSVAWLVDEKQWSRFKSTTLLSLGAFLLGLPSLFSFNLWHDVTFFGSLTFFDLCDKLVTSYMLPLGGMAVAVYSGWFLKRSSSQCRQSLCCAQSWIYPLWSILIRFVAPVAVAVVFIQQLGVI